MSELLEENYDYLAAGETSPPLGLEFDEEAGDALANPDESEAFPLSSEEDVEGLLWLGYLTATDTVFGHRFTLRTITHGEKLAVSLVTKEYEDTLGMADAYAAATIAASLVMLDGHPFGASLDVAEDPVRRIEANFKLVKRWFDPVIQALYQKYAQLRVRQELAFHNLQSK